MVEATFKHNSETGTTTVGDVVGTDIFSQLYSNYPLLFVTNSTERDVHLTISQINTHKIRGANVYIIAEENSYLRDALENIPDTVHKDRYKTGYIVLPKTEDSLLPTFTSTIVLQLLALRMSVKKMRLLDSIRFLNHGVHPDSPKNVSKSITVD
jgi:glucosamine 6-phosphate synthetase-like amidotransferase/phosphosugar isomerase protein